MRSRRRRKPLTRGSSETHTSSPRPLLAGEPWTIDSFQAHRSGKSVHIEMRGWALPDAELGAASPGLFLLNGQPFPDIEYPIDREDVGHVMWMRKNSRYSGFRCAAIAAYESVYPNGALELTYVNPGPSRRVSAQQSWFFPDPAREGPIPEQERRYRV